MPPISDLVIDSKLNVRFFQDYTEHTLISSGVTPRERKLKSVERWARTISLGSGAFGSVWLEKCLTEHPENGEARLRAVKKISKGLNATNPIDYNRELEAIAKFSHRRYQSCFVQSFGWYESRDSIFIAMEYCAHGDLQRYLTAPIPEIEARQIVSQILEGVAFMHENRFAHRDLKPANILVISTGPHWWVKIGDFGISKRAEEGVTGFKTMNGTLGFLAPEVIGLISTKSPRSGGKYTTAVDIWSVGEISFRILTGNTPFENVGALSEYVRGEIKFPLDSLQDLGYAEPACDFVKALMTPEPQTRLTADQALAHDWIGTESPTNSIKDRISGESQRQVLLDMPDPAYPIPEPSALWSTDGEDLLRDVNEHYSALSMSEDKKKPDLGVPDSGYQVVEPSASWTTDGADTLRQQLMTIDGSNDIDLTLSTPTAENPPSNRHSYTYSSNNSLIPKNESPRIPDSTNSLAPNISRTSFEKAEEIYQYNVRHIAKAEEQYQGDLRQVAEDTSSNTTIDHQQVSPSSRRDLGSLMRRFRKSTDRVDEHPEPKSGVFGVPLRQSITYANVAISVYVENGTSFVYGYVPIVVAKCAIFLKEKGTEVEDIFRKSGSLKRVNNLQLIFDSPPKYGKGHNWIGYTVHDAAHTLLRYLAQLPEPVIPWDLYEQFLQSLRQATFISGRSGRTIMTKTEAGVAIKMYQELIKAMPPLNRQLLLYLLDLLAVFAAKSDVNKVVTAELAMIFQPSIIYSLTGLRKLEDTRLSQDVLNFLIQNQDSFLFDILPVKP